MKERKPIEVFLLFCIFICISFVSANEAGGIQVVGTAKISVAPDMATFSFSFNERGKILPKLKAKIDSRSAHLISVCKKLNIDSKHISSAEVSIRPQYNYQTKSFIGYEVSRDISVVLNNLGQYSDLVNGAIDTGITTIRSIDLDTKERVDLENKVLGAAISAAKKKAEIIAKNTETELGRVLSVKEGNLPFESNNYKFRGLAESSPVAMRQGAFEPGEITISTSVVMKYEIKQTL